MRHRGSARGVLALAVAVLTAGMCAGEEADNQWVFHRGDTCAGARMPHEHDKVSLHDSAEACVAHCKSFQEAGAALYHGPGELRHLGATAT